MDPIPIVLDNRIRIELALLNTDEVNALQDAFEHQNPQHLKLRRMNLPTWHEPPVIKTWKEENGRLTFPRGGMQRIREVLRELDRTWVIEDLREEGTGEGDIPDHKLELRDYQVKARDALVKRENALLRAGTGCITGDALIGVNRAGKGSRMTLEHVVHMFYGGTTNGRSWDPNIPTFVRAPMDDGTVRLARLIDARISGRKEVYELRAYGWSVRATLDHRFKTPFGWVPLEDLNPGDHVLVDTNRPSRGTRKKKPWYKLRTLREHPYVGRKGCDGNHGWTVPEHRLVAEGVINGVTLNVFMEAVRRRQPDLVFLDPKQFAVHHKDGNPRNNDPNNLEIMTHAKHREIHLEEAKDNIAVRLVPVEIEEIVYIGEEETYDLEVEGAHAFMANGIAVHNSGKTCVGFAIASLLKKPTLVIVWSGNLYEQWQKRAQTELGMKKDEIGEIRGSKCTLRPLTIAMQQSLASRGVTDEMANYFGVVICDEVQRFAAKTLFDAVDPFPARWRFGISADESRKDRKEFLIYDLFGQVAEDIPREELVKEGHVLDVEIRVIPTDFEAPWYKSNTKYTGPKKHADFNRLLEAMTNDTARNELAVFYARQELASGERLFVMSHRREHCLVLDREISKTGHPTGLLIGGADYATQFRQTIAGIHEGSLRAGVGTYQAIGQGLDVPSVAVGIGVTPIASNRQLFGQARGRVCRTSQGKEGARFYYLWDRRVFGPQHLKNLVAWNTKVRVLDSGRWVDGKNFLARHKEKADARGGW